MTSSFSAEFSLILKLLGGQAQGADVRGVDWDLFCALLERHRIGGTIAKCANLDEGQIFDLLGAQAQQRLMSFERQALAKEFSTIVELQRLLPQMSENGISVTLLKGLSVSDAAYGAMGWRHNYDIDLLVDVPHVDSAAALLQSAGYKRVEPSSVAGAKRWAQWKEQRKDAVFVHEKTHCVVELHWRLFDNPYILTKIAPPKLHPLFGQLSVPVLPTHFNFAYICTHAAQHGFSRLKWLADVYFLAKNMPEDDLARCFEVNSDSVAHTSMALGLLLCEALLSLPLSSGVKRHRAFSHPFLAALQWSAKTMLTRGQRRRLRTSSPVRPSKISVTIFLALRQNIWLAK